MTIISVFILEKQLNEKNQEIRKLRDEWLSIDYESHRKSQGENAQEHILKKEIKNLETYTSSIETELGSLQQDNDSLQQKVRVILRNILCHNKLCVDLTT